MLPSVASVDETFAGWRFAFICVERYVSSHVVWARRIGPGFRARIIDRAMIWFLSGLFDRAFCRSWDSFRQSCELPYS